ncbi:MAG: DNA polymerase/3'-5' exonuclease PolX [Candidatus Omnitrophica bacterium]|jgi:DNA polymerase (family 10)|nr:DNA polymerase/3'-5' exonuclease PolX [Candidatus Omnitrophota bacterium]
MGSAEIADIFREIAKILELKGDNPFRIRAYERAAQAIEDLGEDLERFVKEDKLLQVPGIGIDLANKIKEMFSTGSLSYYQELKKSIPQGLIEMLQIPSLGPKTVKLIYDKLGIDNIRELEKAAQDGRLQRLERIKAKTEENILRGIELLKKGKKRTPLYFALCIANTFIEKMGKIKEVEKITAAGSLRRKKETIGDIDILASSSKPNKVMDSFVKLSLVSKVLAKGSTKSSVIGQDNIQVDLRVVNKNSFGSALLYLTGSKDFNIKLRHLALKRGYKINEYGVFPLKGKNKEKALAGKTEESIFSLMGMQYITPELREDRGELEAALDNNLPQLLELKDIKGDLHVHSEYSDGRGSIKDIVEVAKTLGYKYIGVSDHSQSLKVAGGLSIKELYEKIDEIRNIDKKTEGIKVLCGAEVDILKDGSLDYPDSVLKELDYVIAAIHSGFKQSQEQLTKRIVSACKNKYVNIIAHPTGVLWGQRDPYQVDLDQIFKAAFDYQVALEINCHTQRLDLDGVSAMRAKNAKVKIFLGTDAHEPLNLKLIHLGVSVARRGWLEKKNILNCLNTADLIQWLKK